MSPTGGPFCRSALLAIACLWAPTGTQAQEAAAEYEPADWYRVELMVVANRDRAAAASERWPLLPALYYPPELQRLEHESPTIPADREYRLWTIEQLLPGTSFDLGSLDSPPTGSTGALLQRPQLELEPLFNLTVPRAFALQSSTEREYNREEARLAGNGFEVLFHESWLQPMRDRNESMPILVESEPGQSVYPELQGSILLYSARYLHVETNLWLNTDGHYLESDWSMPSPPHPPRPAPPANAPLRVQLDSLQPVETLAAHEDEEPGYEDAMPVQVADTATADADDATSSTPLENGEVHAGSAPALSGDSDYGFRHAVLVDQRRRMRNGELHYIDHPLLGVLIKVSRYEFEPFIASPSPLSGNP
jgi:hypothetical protein